MKNPTSQQVQTVIDNFEKVLPKAIRQDHLNMNEGKVNFNHDCGTVHCHGGWYAVAVLPTDVHLLNYQDGGDEIAKQLGFENYVCLSEWADDTPYLWGNDYGHSMFSSKVAFCHPEKRSEGAQNLRHIIDHWKEVKERLVQLETKTAAS